MCVPNWMALFAKAPLYVRPSNWSSQSGMTEGNTATGKKREKSILKKYTPKNKKNKIKKKIHINKANEKKQTNKKKKTEIHPLHACHDSENLLVAQTGLLCKVADLIELEAREEADDSFVQERMTHLTCVITEHAVVTA
jgi:hypothetical protein